MGEVEERCSFLLRKRRVASILIQKSRGGLLLEVADEGGELSNLVEKYRERSFSNS